MASFELAKLKRVAAASLPLCPDALLVAFLAPHTLSSGSGEAAGEPGMEVEEERRLDCRVGVKEQMEH